MLIYVLMPDWDAVRQQFWVDISHFPQFVATRELGIPEALELFMGDDGFLPRGVSPHVARPA